MTRTSHRPRLQAGSNQGARRVGPVHPSSGCFPRPVCGFLGIVWPPPAKLCCALSLINWSRFVWISPQDTAGLHQFSYG